MRRILAILCSLCLAVYLLSPPSTYAEGQDIRSLQLAAQPGGKPVICDEIEQRYNVNQGRLNARVLNFLFFDAAERGCLELVRRFLDLGASIGARDRFGNTGLLIAARTGENGVVKLLLERGSAVNHQNLAGSTALLRAVSMNRRRTAKMLLAAGAEPNRVNNRGISPLTAAVFNGNERLVRMLLEAGADHRVSDATGKGPMVYAAGKGFARIARMLLEAGIDVDARYQNDLTALMWAAGHSNDVPVGEGLETVQLLLARGARHDLSDNRGRTALMIAAERGHAEIVAHLVEIGADPLARDREGKTARDLASNEAVHRALGEP